MNGPENRGSRVGEWIAAGLLSAYAVILFAHSGGPSLTDYANWTYQGVLLRDHILGRPDAFHTLKHYPVPNSAATLGIGMLALVLPWLVAAKVYLCLQLAAGWFTLRHLLKTLGGSGLAWLIVPQAVFLNVNFWYGFMNFELGLCWVMLTASLLLRRLREPGRPDWPLGVLLVVAFFTHMIPFALCGLLVVLYAAQTRRWRTVWQLLPSTLVGIWYVLGRYLVAKDADGQAGMVATVREYSAGFWAFKVNSYLKSFGFVNPMGLDGNVFGKLGLWGLLGVTLVLAVLSGVVLLRAAKAGLQTNSEERFLWWGPVALLPVFVLAPGTALGVSDPGARILQSVLALGLVLCWRRAGVRETRAAAACAAVLSLAGLCLFILYGGALGSPRITTPANEKGAARFAHVPSTDQDYFYPALDRGDTSQVVFPTGMFLNKK